MPAIRKQKLKFFTLALFGILLVFNHAGAQTPSITLDAIYESGPFTGQQPSGGLEPQSDVLLFSSIEVSGDCKANQDTYYALWDHIRDAWVINGMGINFQYNFNSGTSGQEFRYQGIYYCWDNNVVRENISNPSVNFDYSLLVDFLKSKGANYWETNIWNMITVGGACNISNAKWGSASGQVNKPINMSVDGTLACRGKPATFRILKKTDPGIIASGGTEVVNEITVNFPGFSSGVFEDTKQPKYITSTNYTPKETGELFFDVEVKGVGGSAGAKAVSSVISVTDAGAGGEPVKIVEKFEPPFGIAGFADIFDKIIGWLVRISIPIGVLMFVVSGVMMMLAQGNPSKISAAKKVFVYTVIGMSVILIGKGFITLIESILSLRG